MYVLKVVGHVLDRDRGGQALQEDSVGLPQQQVGLLPAVAKALPLVVVDLQWLSYGQQPREQTSTTIDT